MRDVWWEWWLMADINISISLTFMTCFLHGNPQLLHDHALHTIFRMSCSITALSILMFRLILAFETLNPYNWMSVLCHRCFQFIPCGSCSHRGTVGSTWFCCQNSVFKAYCYILLYLIQITRWLVRIILFLFIYFWLSATQESQDHKLINAVTSVCLSLILFFFF